MKTGKRRYTFRSDEPLKRNHPADLMPRHCSYFKVDGLDVIACGGSKIYACITCGEVARKLCDWKLGQHTCDAPVCDEHATNVGPDRDLCPAHAKAWAGHPANAQQALEL